MATLHFAERTIELTLVYFGPAQAGCGTNIRHLHRVQPARERAELRRVGGTDRSERMWHFRYHPADTPRISGFDVRVRVVSVPSGEAISLDRDAMFEGIDGLVLVVDARSDRTQANSEALLDVEALLTRQNLDLGAIPVVFQVNQTDAANARPSERVIEELNPFGFPVFEAMARQGRGVLETHQAVLDAVLTRLRDHVASQSAAVTLTAMSPARREKDQDAIAGHAASLPQAGRAAPATLAVSPTAEAPVRVGVLRGSTPLQHVRTDIRGERLRVEALWKREDGVIRKMALLVEAGDDEETGVQRAIAPPQPTSAPAMRRAQRHPDELPPLWWGLGGLTGGLISGVLLGYLLFV